MAQEQAQQESLPTSMCAVRWHPPSFDIRLETVEMPKIEEPDDAIVRVSLAGLCGSDLHIYRGHGAPTVPHICGHEFLGDVVQLGSSFTSASASAQTEGRPELYRTLKVGDRVLSPFTVSCGECHYCRVGFTCRCVHSRLFGTPALQGGQAQYVRVHKAGGTLFVIQPSSSSTSDASLNAANDVSLLLLCDILPTGVFAAVQLLQHSKLAPILLKRPWPYNAWPFVSDQVGFNVLPQDHPQNMTEEDAQLTIALIGLGPVGICALVSFLDILSHTSISNPVRLIAIDPLASRRDKAMNVYSALDARYKLDAGSKGAGNHFVVLDIEEAKTYVKGHTTGGIGCNGIMELVGNNSALSLAYDLVRPFGVISSVGVHQEPPLPLTGRQVYDKNVSFDFGRCPVRTLFPFARDVLAHHQPVFGAVGGEANLVERIAPLGEASKWYEEFDKGRCGKVLFDPWQ